MVPEDIGAARAKGPRRTDIGEAAPLQQVQGKISLHRRVPRIGVQPVHPCLPVHRLPGPAYVAEIAFRRHPALPAEAGEQGLRVRRSPPAPGPILVGDARHVRTCNPQTGAVLIAEVTNYLVENLSRYARE